MDSSQIINKEYELFNQREYSNTFYYCKENHPFIAFTTCYCPLCEYQQEYNEIWVDKENVESAFYNLEEDYYSLVGKVKKHAPELLI